MFNLLDEIVYMKSPFQRQRAGHTSFAFLAYWSWRRGPVSAHSSVGTCIKQLFIYPVCVQEKCVEFMSQLFSTGITIYLANQLQHKWNVHVACLLENCVGITPSLFSTGNIHMFRRTVKTTCGIPEKYLAITSCLFSTGTTTSLLLFPPPQAWRSCFQTCFDIWSFVILSFCLQQLPGGIWSSHRV